MNRNPFSHWRPSTLINLANLWDIPLIKLTADERDRVCAAELLRPGTTFEATCQNDGSIRLIELVEKEVPGGYGHPPRGRFLRMSTANEARTSTGHHSDQTGCAMKTYGDYPLSAPITYH